MKTFIIYLLILLSYSSLSVQSFVQAQEKNSKSFFFQKPTPTIPSPPTVDDKPYTKLYAFPTHKKENISALAGKVAPVLSKLWITPEKARNIFVALKTVTDVEDVIFIGFFGWVLLPILRLFYSKYFLAREREGDFPPKKPFVDTKLFLIANLIAEAGRIAAMVFSIDCLAISLETIGFNVQNFSKLTAKAVYMTWIFTRINRFRNYLVSHAFRYNGPDEKRRRRSVTRANTVNKLLDFAIWGTFVAILLDVLNVKAGMFLNSFFAVGGAGTLVLSFASKDMAMQFVSGFALQASDKVYEGEEVQFGNGIKGTVLKVGVLETLVKHNGAHDQLVSFRISTFFLSFTYQKITIFKHFTGELITAVPNKEFSNQRLTNLSRLKFSQFTQTLRFDYDDADKINDIIDAIRKEIRETCPVVVTDGSRPFRVFWSSYGESALEVLVDVRMAVPPLGDKHLEAKQSILLAIQRALNKVGVKLVVLETPVTTIKK